MERRADVMEKRSSWSERGERLTRRNFDVARKITFTAQTPKSSYIINPASCKAPALATT
jgi:hypothetical protein